MAVFTFGDIGEFDSSADDWNSYTESLEQYLMANAVGTLEKKRAVLLSSVGASTYKLIRNLTSPHPPGSRTYKEIIDLVRDHFNPKPSVINDFWIQRRLLSEPELTPKKAFELAQALETVDKDAREVMTSTQVNVLQKKPNRSAIPPTNGPVCVTDVGTRI